MELLNNFEMKLILSVLPAVVLFLYGIEQFSKELLRVAGETFRTQLQRLAKTQPIGVVSGMVATAILQSSTAMTIIVVGLVDAGTLSFSQSLGLIAGANIGTTITTQLIAFKLTQFAPLFIVIGFIIDLIGGRYKFVGKPLFYFGLVFFSLTLIADATEALKAHPEVISLFSHFTNPAIGILAGFILTNIFMSSAVTAGLAVIFAQAGLLSLYDGILIILGAHIGTTTTALLAAARMENSAKRAAVAHFMFNFFGVLLILPVLGDFSRFVEMLGGGVGQQLANAHLLVNVIATIVFLIVIRQFEMLIRKIVPSDEKEIVFATKYLNDELPKKNEKALELVKNEIKHALEISRDLFEETINAIKTKTDRRNRVQKLEAYTDFLDQKITIALVSLSKRKLTKEELEETVILTRISNQVEHFADIAKMISITYSNLYERGIHLSDASRAELLGNYAIIRDNLDILRENFDGMDKDTAKKMRAKDDALRKRIEKTYEAHMKRMLEKSTNYGSIFIELIVALDEANERIRNIRKILMMNKKAQQP